VEEKREHPAGDQINIDTKQSQIGAIGSHATGTVSGTINIDREAANEINAEELRAALTELYAALGQANLPPDKLIEAQTAVGTAINQDIKEGKVEPDSLVSNVQRVGETLQEANVVVQKGTSLWESVQKLAPLVGPIVGGARIVGRMFGVPIP
jgi:hypothetical protein